MYLFHLLFIVKPDKFATLPNNTTHKNQQEIHNDSSKLFGKGYMSPFIVCQKQSVLMVYQKRKVTFDKRSAN